MAEAAEANGYLSPVISDEQPTMQDRASLSDLDQSLEHFQGQAIECICTLRRSGCPGDRFKIDVRFCRRADS